MAELSLGPTGSLAPTAAATKALPAAWVRLQSIDALRGIVMVLMLLDHLRQSSLIAPLYIPTASYSRLKKRRRDIAWLKYF